MRANLGKINGVWEMITMSAIYFLSNPCRAVGCLGRDISNAGFLVFPREDHLGNRNANREEPQMELFH